MGRMRLSGMAVLRLQSVLLLRQLEQRSSLGQKTAGLHWGEAAFVWVMMIGPCAEEEEEQEMRDDEDDDDGGGGGG